MFVYSQSNNVNVEQTVSNFDQHAVVRNTLMLASVPIKQWGMHKLDKKATNQVNTDARAEDKSARVNKRLLPKEATAGITAAVAHIRTVLYKHTLPWTDEGLRVLSTASYYAFMEEMTLAIDRFNHAVDEFIPTYDHWVNEAARAYVGLGGLFDPADYPTAAEVRSKFSARVSLMDLPNSKDFRVDLDDEHLARIRADIDERVAECMQLARADVQARVIKVLQPVVDKLGDEKAVFRNSLVGNIDELAALLPGLNIGEDEDVATVTDELKALTAAGPQRLRDDLQARHATTQAARSLLDKVASWS